MAYYFTITVDIDSDTDVPMAELARRLTEVAALIGDYAPEDFECGRTLRRFGDRAPLADITVTTKEDFSTEHP